MLKASVKGKYDGEKSGCATTLAFNAGDVNLRASMTDATFVNGPSLNGLSLSLEKPGSFIIDYDVPTKDVSFLFMNTIRVLDKPVNLTYTHAKGDNLTAMDGTLVLDSSNKVSASYAFDSGNCKLRYNYVHKGVTTFEPRYDFEKNAWDFEMSRRVYNDDILRASYVSSTRVLGLEWLSTSNFNGTFKVSATVNLAEKSKMPKLIAESTWNFET